MASKRKFNACTPRPKQDGGVWWHKVGSAYENEKGQISVYLNSVPVPDPEKENQVCFTLFEDTERDAERREGRRPAPRTSGNSNKDDDEIPF
jgi:hypothetical protein